MIVALPIPKRGHALVERRLVKLLEPLTSGGGILGTRFAFRPLPEHELWCADVAFVSKSRWTSIDPEDNLYGAPELVIEVLSPSNTVSEIDEKQAMCLENGCLEFWTVDPQRKTVKLSTPDRKTITYIESEKIPLTNPAAGELLVSEIFA